MPGLTLLLFHSVSVHAIHIQRIQSDEVDDVRLYLETDYVRQKTDVWPDDPRFVIALCLNYHRKILSGLKVKIRTMMRHDATSLFVVSDKTGEKTPVILCQRRMCRKRAWNTRKVNAEALRKVGN
jgi:hypothetical protein